MPRSHYAHRRPFLKQSDIHPVPYLGWPEDLLQRSFLDAYIIMRAHLAMTDFSSHTALTAMATVEAHLIDAQVAFHQATLPTFEMIVHGGAADGRLQILAPGLAKAAAPERKTRFRFLDEQRRERKVFTGARLSGLQPTARAGHRSYNAPPRHVEAARNLSLRLVTDVTRTQRTRLRTLVTQSITRGIDVDSLGVRLSHIVGLFPRWQQAVNKLYANMLDNDVPVHLANIRVQNYADELLAKRGTMIARTELLRAMNVGRWAGWHDLADKGFLDADRAGKQWTSAEDHDICPECDYLGDPMGDHKGGLIVIGLDTPFETEFGPVIMPPAHPHCRCGAVILQPVDTPAPNVDDAGWDQSLVDESTISAPEIERLISVMA